MTSVNQLPSFYYTCKIQLGSMKSKTPELSFLLFVETGRIKNRGCTAVSGIANMY